MRQDVEFLRVLGAIGVVWFHLGIAGHDIGYGGLVLFIALGAYFSINTTGGWSGSFLIRRANRILVPWLFWVFVFGLINVLRGYVPFPKGNSPVAAVLIGPSVHLWYLPFALVVAIVSGFLGGVLGSRMRLALGLAIAGAGFLTVGLLRTEHSAMSYPYAQYLHALPAVGLGWAMAGASGERAGIRLLVLFTLALSILPGTVLNGYGTAYWIGLLLITPVLFPELIAVNFSVDRISRFMFGVYLVHPLFIPLARRLGLADSFIALPLTFGLSLGLVILIRRVAPQAGAKVT
ncbi:MAG: acyltransferase [Burkholderiaceae bacterium]|nr:acyltransferase [Burkholderiaceae bacterium]